jgi:hypothetical protein
MEQLFHPIHSLFLFLVVGFDGGYYSGETGARQWRERPQRKNDCGLKPEYTAKRRRKKHGAVCFLVSFHFLQFSGILLTGHT